MKINLLTIAIISLFFFSCNSGNDNNEEVVYENIRDTASAAPTEDSVYTVVNRPSLWTVELQENQKTEKLKKPADEKIKTLSAFQLISALNDNFTGVNLHYEKTSHDTMYVAIPESEQLTQQMGSTGAYNYMATAVFNLTELNNIKYVHFTFKGGDHAVPGTFSREDYKQLR